MLSELPDDIAQALLDLEREISEGDVTPDEIEVALGQDKW